MSDAARIYPDSRRHRLASHTGDSLLPFVTRSHCHRCHIHNAETIAAALHVTKVLLRVRKLLLESLCLRLRLQCAQLLGQLPKRIHELLSVVLLILIRCFDRLFQRNNLLLVVIVLLACFPAGVIAVNRSPDSDENYQDENSSPAYCRLMCAPVLY